MTTAAAIWLITLVFFLTHQIEEVIYSIAAWRVASSSRVAAMDGLVEQITACIARPTNQGSHGRGQTAGVILLGAATSGSLIATQLATTVLITGLMLAFVMHISASVLTRSAMPGLATSILPGLPRGGDATDLRLDPLTRIRIPRVVGPPRSTGSDRKPRLFLLRPRLLGDTLRGLLARCHSD